MNRQACELSIAEARQGSTATAATLMTMASAVADPGGAPCIHRNWVPSAGTWCYHTVISAAIGPDSLSTAADIFFQAASRVSQPWYPQFLGGQVMPSGNDPNCAVTLARFDVGLGKPRAYRQLVSRHANEAATMRAIVLRSVEAAMPWPDGAVPAFALSPSGDVLEYRAGRLLWHHICTTPGAALLPMPWDRWFINALRGLRLDQAERNTYRQEALMWARWASQGFPEGDNPQEEI